MTKQQAVRTLIRHAAANLNGSGPLAHNNLTRAAEDKAVEAIKVLWNEAGMDLDIEHGLQKLGLRWVEF